MKTHLVIFLLLAFVAGIHSASAQPTPATETTSDPPKRTAEKPVPPPATRPALVREPEVVPVPAPTPVPQHDNAELLFAQSMLLLQEQERLLQQQRMLLKPKQPAQPLWLLPLLIGAVTSSLVAIALQPFLFRRSSAAAREIHSKVESGVRFLQEKIQSGNADVAEKVEGARTVAVDRLAILSTDLGNLTEGLARLTQTVEESVTVPGSTAGDAVRLEHQVLAEHWKQFRDKKDLGVAGDVPQENPWNLLTELTALVPAELQPSFEAVLTPYREHRRLIQKIEIIPRVVSGEMPLSSEAAELKRARDLTQLLIAAQSIDGNDRFHFQLQSWVTDTFLPFADLYLQSCQKAHLEQRDAELQKGMSLVRQILRVASVEPMDLTLGETRFDSARHIGRLTSSDPRFPDGVITGVVRNGFVEAGQQVIRQPEVVVNRVR